MSWKLFKDEKPPEMRNVLVTNNPSARTAQGHMSHIWLCIPFKKDRSTEWMGWGEGGTVHSLIAWCDYDNANAEEPKK